MQYNDFIITVEGQWGEYVVKAEHKIGDTQRPIGRFPFNAVQLFENQRPVAIFKQIQQAIHRRTFDSNLLSSFGEEIFRGLFQDSIAKALEAARFYASAERRFLRIRLQLPRDLQGLPWELMCTRGEKDDRQFLCLDPGIGLVRSGAGDRSEAKIIADFPIRILAVVCTPLDFSPLKMRREIDHLLRALADLISTGKVQMDFVHGANTLERLKHLMRATEYHVIHFMGHSNQGGGPIRLILEDENGKGEAYTAPALFQRLGQVRPPAIVFLNACEGAAGSVVSPLTSIAESLLAVGVSAVIAHQFEISDEAAESFSKDVYETLISETSIEESVTLARCKLHDKFSFECFTPVLFLRSSSASLRLTNHGEETGERKSFATQKAEEARRAKRWSEAADYNHIAMLITPDDDQSDQLLQTALAQEELNNHRHNAIFARSNGNWPEVESECIRYLKHPLATTRPRAERADVASMKLEIYLAQARAAEAERDWVKAATAYDRYFEDPAHQELPAADQTKTKILRNLARLGAGVRDPELRWRG
jgi:hypothetical protein